MIMSPSSPLDEIRATESARMPLRDGDTLASEEVAGLPEVLDGLKHTVASVDVLATDVDARVREVFTPQLAADVARLGSLE